MTTPKFGSSAFKPWLWILTISCSFLSADSLLCSEVEFCSSLRARPATAVYAVDIYTIEIDDIGIIRFNLLAINSDDENLEVSIFAYKDDILRVKIKELNSTRFELSDVFAGAPNLAGVQSVDTDASKIVITTNIGSRLVVTLGPFRLDFIRDDILEVVLNGDRLFVDNLANSQSFSVGLTFPNSDYLYGLHQHPMNLPLWHTEGGEPFRLFNLEHPSFAINITDSIYGAVPFIYGHGAQATAGVFLHNAAQQFVDILPNGGNNTAYFMVEAGTLDVFVFLGPTPAEVLRQYLLITGVPHMPPLWSLGYHQSRYSYVTQEDAKEVVANFDNYNLQLDAIWLDIDHTDAFKYFTWNPETYSDPLELQSNLSATNRKIVVISDPHIKVEEGYGVYDGALENELFVLNADGSVFEGNCWPGLSSYIDFLNPEARAYYASRYYYEHYPNSTSIIAGFWNDMNEPIVFDSPASENVMPGDCLHYRNVQHRELHNAYGMLQTRATHQGLLERDNRTTRPFVLSRSHFAGSQRYTAIWTGDIYSDWPLLAISIPMCLNANLMGIVFCGTDVAGFNGNPDNELFGRWYQAGAWYPFFRAHSDRTTERREPYLFPDDVQEIVRNAIQLRYKHLPVWYTLFHEYIAYKTPVIRPLWFHYTSDKNVFPIDNQYLVGSDIMVCPVTESGVTSVPVYFPGGTDELWFSIDSWDVYQGTEDYVDVAVDLSSIPIYYRAGSLIVRKETIRPSTTEMYDDLYTLFVNVDGNGTAHGTVYLDDTTSLNYLDYVEYNYLSVDYNLGEVTFTKIDSHANSGQFEFQVHSIVTHEIEEMPTQEKPGKYIEKRYRTDVTGNSLKNLKINFDNYSEMSFKLL